MGTGTTTECGSAEGTMWANYIPSYKTRGACLGRLHARQCHDVLSRVGVFFGPPSLRRFGPDGKKKRCLARDRTVLTRLFDNILMKSSSHSWLPGTFFE